MRNARFILMSGVFLMSAVSCSSSPGGPGGTICTAEARPALTVFVRDSSSGAPIGRGSSATATDGIFVATATYPGGTQDDLPLSLAHERAGIYTVVVKKPGYRDWRASGVRVTRDDCHVITVTLTARLELNTLM